MAEHDNRGFVISKIAMARKDDIIAYYVDDLGNLNRVQSGSLYGDHIFNMVIFNMANNTDSTSC